ncbi:hypothetical protein Btru_073542 [Bulinus truncatus]|nr:hypothetical protein Btru_073542 [Bulinus truncatus]
MRHYIAWAGRHSLVNGELGKRLLDPEYSDFKCHFQYECRGPIQSLGPSPECRGPIQSLGPSLNVAGHELLIYRYNRVRETKEFIPTSVLGPGLGGGREVGEGAVRNVRHFPQVSSFTTIDDHYKQCPLNTGALLEAIHLQNKIFIFGKPVRGHSKIETSNTAPQALWSYHRLQNHTIKIKMTLIYICIIEFPPLSHPNRRITSASLASQLQRSAKNSPSSTRRSSFGSDEIFDDIEGNFQNVDGRLKFLEDQLQHLTQVQTETNTKQIKLKDENNVLVQKVLFLEEQLRDMEVKADDRLIDERRKYQEFLSKQEREKNEQVDYITQRLHRIEHEYEELKQEAPRLQTEISKLRTEKMDIQERLLERQETYNILYDEHEKLKADYHRQEVLNQKERHATSQLLNEMEKELDELRKYRMEVETGSRSPSGSISELPGRYRDLQSEIHKLREENKHLHDSNEELNAQLLNQCIGEGKSLLHSTEGQSLAQELEHLTKEELLAQLKLERDVNFRLKQYVDHIIMTILEKNPSLLDITHR